MAGGRLVESGVDVVRPALGAAHGQAPPGERLPVALTFHPSAGDYRKGLLFEISPHVIQAFMSAIEGFRVGLGPVRLLYYALQGLYHPARKVRDVYWKVYNTLYISAQDSLVAGYPRIKDEGKNKYARYELDYFL